MSTIQRTFIPGSSWIYFKLYTGKKTADDILINVINPIIKKLQKERFIEKLFFIRFNDPDFHLRIRVLVPNNQHIRELICLFYQKLNKWNQNNLIWKIQLDTYNRELERYNPYLIEDTESLFDIDSLYIIQILRQLRKMQDEKYRWMISLLLIDKLLSDFDFSIEQKKDLMVSASNAFKSEFGFDEYNSKQFNEKYRANKATIELILNNAIIDENYSRLVKIVNQRSFRMRPVIKNIQQIIQFKRLNIRNYAGDYIHMTMNRLFRTDNRIYELIIYDFMRRYYTSQIAINNQLKMGASKNLLEI